MIQKTITLDPKAFFHARPAAKISSMVKDFDSVIMVMVGTEIADAKNPVSLMRLGHPNGSPIDLIADGPDEEAALAAILEEIQNCLP